MTRDDAADWFKAHTSSFRGKSGKACALAVEALTAPSFSAVAAGAIATLKPGEVAILQMHGRARPEHIEAINKVWREQLGGKCIVLDEALTLVGKTEAPQPGGRS